MVKPVSWWTAEETEVVLAGIRDGLPPSALAVHLPGRNLNSIHGKMRSIEEAARNPPAEKSVPTAPITPDRSEHSKNLQGDYRFKMAMLAAIESKQERAVIGVVKDRRPIAVHRYERVYEFSSCTSSALLCVEFAGSSFKHQGPHVF